LTVNETKTHIRELPQERFDFLGYTFGRCYSPKTGRAYLCPQPSKKSVQRMIGDLEIIDCHPHPSTRAALPSSDHRRKILEDRGFSRLLFIFRGQWSICSSTLRRARAPIRVSPLASWLTFVCPTGPCEVGPDGARSTLLRASGAQGNRRPHALSDFSRPSARRPPPELWVRAPISDMLRWVRSYP
jgi:hypothetical protein